jgi:hypothetical protein
MTLMKDDPEVKTFGDEIYKNKNSVDTTVWSNCKNT